MLKPEDICQAVEATEQGNGTHIPVLYREAIEGLGVRPGGKYIDCTIGEGGHAQGILEASAPTGRLLGLDADGEAIARSRERIAAYGERATLVWANFREVAAVARRHGFYPVEGVLFDLGLSSRQLACAGRGFSFRMEGPLDMRFDQRGGTITAGDLANELSERELADLLWRYGEERHSRRIARAIVRARPLSTTRDLAEVIRGAVGRRGRLHPATRSFQALRMAVNEELQNLKEGLEGALECLGPGGRLVVISFHSLEDRVVKDFFRRESRNYGPEVAKPEHLATLRTITKRPIRPSQEEAAANPRSRSARMRIAERLGQEEPTYG